MKVNEGEVPQYIVEQSHPAVIDPDQWEKVQTEMAVRKSRGRHHNCLSPFSAKIICGACGEYYGPNTDGPVLITAGPGTGKTFTLVQRAIYLIQEKGVRPEEIMLATFTEKAAKELITRITNELAARGIVANINEMYIGTFHSLCLRIIKEHLEYTRLKKNFRTLDQFDQSYTVFQNIFRAISMRKPWSEC